jgi:hypothetical protein
MGFALWLDDHTAWAAGTHEYRPMGVAVIARSDLFRARDFSRYRRAPSRRDSRFQGLFGSLEEVNHFLRGRRAAKPGRTRAII